MYAAFLLWSLSKFRLLSCVDMHTVSSSTDLNTIQPGSCTCMDMPWLNLLNECKLYGYFNHSLQWTRVIDTTSSCNTWTPFEVQWKPFVTKCCQAAPIKEKWSVLFGVPKLLGLWGKDCCKILYWENAVKNWLVFLYAFKIHHMAMQNIVFNAFSKKVPPICKRSFFLFVFNFKVV